MKNKRSFLWMTLHLIISFFSFVLLFRTWDLKETDVSFLFRLYFLFSMFFSFVTSFYFAKKFFLIERNHIVSSQILHPTTKKTYHIHFQEIGSVSGLTICNLDVNSDGKTRTISYELNCPCGFMHTEERRDNFFMGYVHEWIMDKCPKCEEKVPKELLKVENSLIKMEF